MREDTDFTEGRKGNEELTEKLGTEKWETDGIRKVCAAFANRLAERVAVISVASEGSNFVGNAVKPKWFDVVKCRKMENCMGKKPIMRMTRMLGKPIAGLLMVSYIFGAAPQFSLGSNPIPR